MKISALIIVQMEQLLLVVGARNAMRLVTRALFL